MRFFRVLALTVGGVFVPPVLYHWPLAAWVAFLLLLASITVPAILLISRMGAGRPGLIAASVSACLGVSAYCFFWAIARRMGLSPAMATFAAVPAANVFVAGFFWSAKPPMDGPGWTKQEIAGLVLLCLVTMVFVRGPFVHFGSDEGASIGFPYLGVTDVFTHVAIIGEVAKGTPPMNPYFSGEVLRYYWLSHVLPASLHAITGGQFIVPALLQMTFLSFSLLSVTLLAGILRASVLVPVSWISAAAVGLFLSTYVWLVPVGERLAALLSNYLPVLQRLAVERGETYSGLSHGFLRDFVTEPHGVQALNLLFALILWNSFVSTPGSRQKGVSLFLEGCVLGICFGTDAFLGVIGTLWWLVVRGLFGFGEWSPGRSMRVLIPLGLGLIAVQACLFGLHILGGGGSNLRVVPYVRMLVLLPVVVILEYGPVGVLGVIGAKPLLENLSQRRVLRDAVLLGLAALPVMFLLQHEYVHNLVFRKSLRIVRLPLLLGVAVLFDQVRRRKRWTSLRARAALAVVLALAIPGTLLDHFHLSRSDGGGRSVMLAKSDAEAYSWLRTNTARDAVIQGWPDYGNKSNFSPAIVISERRAALGDFIRTRNYLPRDAALEERARALRDVVFGSSGSIADAVERLREYGITHVYVGDVERSHYGPSVSKFGAHPELFRRIYDRQGIQVFEVR